ncbi:glycosyl hydrolase [Brumimicrobium salinarum]|uniref:Glycosyl hydrolase n=1 Tax=Brumimicrobium salinarum TaxID=2058658 RepID=A0A2I0R3E2_9FLAO|nr:GH25 family lysozyme [Brumimicrobium salinarum]PKR81087.1 glycosyl hydrolase [Brumimicrobium salinarum]
MKKSTHLILHLIVLSFFGYLLWSSVVLKFKNDFNFVIPSNYASFGIDVSHHQGKIDWEALLQEDIQPQIQFIYAKATEGRDHLDSQWEYNRQKLIKLKAKHGAYHFFRPKTDSREQAIFFLKHYNPLPTDLAPVLDVELEGSSDEQLIKDVYTFLKTVEQETGKRPIIYTSYHFYQTKFKNEFQDYKFWIAAYSLPFILPKDKRILYWQFTDQAQLPHHEGIKIDLNVGRVQFN